MEYAGFISNILKFPIQKGTVEIVIVFAVYSFKVSKGFPAGDKPE